MKQLAIASFVITAGFALPALAQKTDMDPMQSMDMSKGGMDKPASAKSQMTHKTMGVVKKLDAGSGTVTLKHEPVKSLDWPAMTMGFKVTDKTLMDKLATDKKVEFEFVQEGKEYVVTSVKPMP